jgi:polyribonucleotide nucleotidyltransferase
MWQEKRRGEKLLNANYDPDKLKRREKVSLVKNEIIESFPNNNKQEIEEIVNIIEAEVVRKKIIETGERPDGRMPEDLRPISCSIGVLPRTHGSAIFTRGQTQTLVVTTLGTSEDVQILDELEGYTKKRFMFHYNFPPFSVGETTPMKGPTRREIGHGSLAERAVLPLIPSEDKFPYVIQIVSDILSSNGSSSMASVCGASLSLMDAGIPIKTHVAGISVGLIKENEKYRILTDIQGLEDHFGDMDFKIAGTKYGITAIQLDMKIDGLELNILEEAMYQSKKARDVILDILNKTISSPRPNLSEYAPRIVTIHINPAKIKDVIGPAGKNIKKIIEEFNVTIDISPDGKIKIASNNPESSAKAISAIKEIAQEPEIGKIYFGKVIRVADYGAFVEIFPGTVGLVHISQIIDGRVRRVSDYLREGDEVFVKVIDIDENNRIRLSYKQAVAEMKLNEKDSFRKTKRGI